MKKYFLIGLSFTAFAAGAQKTTAKPAAKPAAKNTKPVAANPLKNANDSVSYAIGVLVASYYKNQQGINKLNSSLVAKAVNDVYGNKKPLLNDNQCNMAIIQYTTPDLTKTMKASEAFLAENKKRPEIKTTASGLQYEVLVQGTGTKPTPSDTITAHYRGTLIDGTEFDNSYKRGEPLTLQLGSVIAGWIEGMQLMPTGSKYKLYIPYQLGYGMNTTGSIPGGSALIFEVELLKVNGKQ
jgi:FKBP-type peptidyl-prolyl cis-trans isomerase